MFFEIRLEAAHVLRRADEGERDVVDARLDRPVEILEVLGRVSDGMGSASPGRLTPLCELTSPHKDTGTVRGLLDSWTDSRTRPSSINTSMPARKTWPITAGAIGRSSSRATSSPATTHSSPRARRTGASRSPTRSFGPCRSAISAIRPAGGLFGFATRAARAAWSACVPCDMLSRAPPIPASISAASISGDDEAGPIVATIFVRRRAFTIERAEMPTTLGIAQFSPSSSSIRRSWLYLATRSDRAGAPVLI